VVDIYDDESDLALPQAVTTIPESMSSTRFELFQNVPNPFNPQTAIHFTIPADETVFLRVFDLSGRLVKELVAGSDLKVGSHEVTWNGCDAAGQAAAAGIYFYQLTAGSISETRRMTLLK